MSTTATQREPAQTLPPTSWLRMPALLGWLALSAGIGLAQCLPWQPLSVAHMNLLWAAATACLVIFALVHSPLVRVALMCACGVAVLTAERGRQFDRYAYLSARAQPRQTLLLTGRVATVPHTDTTGRVSYLVSCDSLCDGQGLVLLRGGLMRCRALSQPQFGRATLLRGTFSAPRLPDSGRGFDQYAYLLSNGIWGTFWAEGQVAMERRLPLLWRANLAVRGTVYAAMSHVRDAGRRALLLASLIGEKDDIPRELQLSFTTAGFAHLLALSGLNVAIVAGALLALLRPLPLPLAAKTLATVAGLWCYLGLAGPIPSLVRATIMGTLLLAAPLIQRRSCPLNALGVAGIVWLCLAPQSMFTAGYQLSFAATAGIILLFRPIKQLFADLSWAQPAAPRLLLDSAIVSLAAFAATAPVLAWHFGRLSVYGLAANVVAVSMMTVCTWFLCAGVALQALYPQLAWLSMQAADGLMMPIVALARLGAQVPLLHVEPMGWPAMTAYAGLLVGAAAVGVQHAKHYLLLAAPLALAVVALSGALPHGPAPAARDPYRDHPLRAAAPASACCTQVLAPAAQHLPYSGI